MILTPSSIGDFFQKETKYYRGQAWSQLDWSKKPDNYKAYPSKTDIKLATSIPEHADSFADLLSKRKSVRNYSKKPMSVEDLSFLLWASTGINRRRQGFDFRTAPSAGALYPIETYLIVNNVEGLNKGLYHYNIKAHSLEELKLGEFAEDIGQAALEQEMCAKAPVVFIWSAVFKRTKWKYKQRAYRYVYLDAGHVAQNLALAATSVGLGSCQIGAMFDDEVNEIIGADGVEESTLYLSVVGHPKNE